MTFANKGSLYFQLRLYLVQLLDTTLLEATITASRNVLLGII